MTATVTDIYIPTPDHVVLAAIDGWCFNMDIAPRSPGKQTLHGHCVTGYYLQLFCPDECIPDRPEAGICIGWWEPHEKGAQGCWMGEGGFELMPVAWRYLPKPPAWDFARDRLGTACIPHEGMVS